MVHLTCLNIKIDGSVIKRFKYETNDTHHATGLLMDLQWLIWCVDVDQPIIMKYKLKKNNTTRLKNKISKVT